MLKPGGTMVYSTCTFNPHENERILSFHKIMIWKLMSWNNREDSSHPGNGRNQDL